MAWNCYELIYRALSPVHIGYRKLGIIQRTRYYIPGRNLWGAITANLTRTCYSQPGNKEYKNVGKFVKENVIASYFYPQTGEAGSYYPHFTEEGLRFDSKDGKVLTAAQFEARFISSFAQTALTASNLTAEEATLHETEFLSNCTETATPPGQQVFFHGTLYIKQGTRGDYPTQVKSLDDKQILGQISEIFVGGERAYGFGRLRLEGGMPKQLKTGDKLFGSYELILDQKFPVIKVPKGEVFPAHVVADGVTAVGEAEPLVSREWESDPKRSPKGAGQRLSFLSVCWVPGSVAQRDLKVEVSDFGILTIKG